MLALYIFFSGLNNYIVRRYAATSRGVYYVYPGTPSSLDFEPARQDWFSKAEQFPQRVVATQPRLDPGGSGYIVSLSQVTLSHCSMNTLRDFSDYLDTLAYHITVFFKATRVM